MPTYLFWLFSTVMLIGACAVIAFRNPVSSALAMVTSFVGLAALFIGLSAFFVGVIQILVYSGAIMVLFLFIIMLLDLKDEQKRADSFAPLAAGLVLVGAFFIQLVGVLSHKLPFQTAPPLDKETLAAVAATGEFGEGTKITEALSTGSLPDIHLIGHTLFTEYNLPLQILGVLLLVSTVGVVVLSKRQTS
ncbi:NADH-quinone oxidoreductase subunit J [Luteolibacter sp. AS25]|uniref:NADH-quinone oxidoreductase subunit J family protein n=1 Tax=Luteolibacter sp. AS25 TaxID=3135776 RepID=UPI00398B16F4